MELVLQLKLNDIYVKCRKYSQIRFNGIYEDYCNFSIRMKNKAVKIRTKG